MVANERLIANADSSSRPGFGARREQIVGAAAQLFSAHGYRGTSMQDIGEKVGLLKGSLYAHVANKEELLLEIVSTAARRFATALEPVAHGDATAPRKLRLALHAHLQTAQALGPAARVFLLEARHLQEQPAHWVREERARYEALWQGIFRQGVAEGSFRRDLDPHVATALALAAANRAQQDNSPLTDATAEEALVDRFCDLLLDGFR